MSLTKKLIRKLLEPLVTSGPEVLLPELAAESRCEAGGHELMTEAQSDENQE